MVKVMRLLADDLQPEKYSLKIEGEQKNGNLTIVGRKAGRPSKRITLHQKGLKVLYATITALNSNQSAEVIRINHLPTFEQVRLHTKDVLFPGNYRLELGYNLPPSKIGLLNTAKPSRELLPCIDEPEAWAKATFEIKQ